MRTAQRRPPTTAEIWEEDDADPLEPLPPEGMTFTHRLELAEAAEGVVAFSPDLEPLGPMCDPDGILTLSDGHAATIEITPEKDRVLVGPAGWLESWKEGELVGFRVGSDHVALVPVAETNTPDWLTGALRSELDRSNDGDGFPVGIAELLNGVFLGTPAPPGTVLLPVSDLLPACGFEMRGGFTGPVGTEWDAFDNVIATTAIAVAFGLGPAEAHELLLLCALYRGFAGGDISLEAAEPEVLSEAAELLEDGDVASAFVHTIIGAEPLVAGGEGVDPAADLQRFVACVKAGIQAKGLGAGIAWVGAAASRHLGRHEEAEAQLRRALEIDPEHLSALEDAAWYASDRGDAQRAVSLLYPLADLGDHYAEVFLGALRPFAAPRTALAGRNDRCPCGSGRKYKHCHLGAERTIPLPERIGWISTKLTWFLHRTERDLDLVDVLLALVGTPGCDELLVAWLVLFADRAVDDFLRLRGSLLPPDERELVLEWAAIELSVHEVVAVEKGVGVTVRDLRAGTVLAVLEGLGSRRMKVGDLLVAHPVPDGETHRFVGGVIPIPLHQREEIVAALDTPGSAVEIAERIAAAFSASEAVEEDNQNAGPSLEVLSGLSDGRDGLAVQN